MLDGALGVDCSVIWRNLSTNGVGINTNYLMDISPEWRNAGGPAFQDSLQVEQLLLDGCFIPSEGSMSLSLCPEHYVTLQSHKQLWFQY